MVIEDLIDRVSESHTFLAGQTAEFKGTAVLNVLKIGKPKVM